MSINLDFLIVKEWLMVCTRFALISPVVHKKKDNPSATPEKYTFYYKVIVEKSLSICRNNLPDKSANVKPA